jgi:hypothetical protein
MPIPKKTISLYPRRFIQCLVIAFLPCCFSVALYAQQPVPGDTSLIPTKDLGDLIKKILGKKVDTAKAAKQRKVAILPSLGYNPSFGFTIGAKLSGIKQLGSEGNTDLSSFGLEAIYSTKGVVTAQFRHNVFTKANKWNFQGNWQLSKYLIADYGIGTGNKEYRTKTDSTFLIRFTFIRLTEKLYRKVGKNLFAGGGISFDIRKNIDDELLNSLQSSPHYRYSLRNGFNPEQYSANGLLLALQYNTREHPTRSYGGIYADLNLRFNQQWMGSSKNAVQVAYDFRKYWSLSKKNPEHVLAFWHWASYRLGGTIPYLELPATGYDTYSRSGRGYTIGRFKGPSFVYFEPEYRFPITKNRLVSGVAFVNFQSASDDLAKKLFQYWETAAGAGLRILFQKQSRSTICIDYAWGKYGSKGIFFGLNEVF